MKLLLGIGVSVLIVAGGVATYHFIAGKVETKPRRYGIRRAGINDRGQPVISDIDRLREGTNDPSMADRVLR